MIAYFVSTWIVYVASMGSIHPLLQDSPSFDTRQECEEWIADEIGKDEIELEDGVVVICWPEPANARAQTAAPKGV